LEQARRPIHRLGRHLLIAPGAGARVLACADAYHAMTEPRPHRPALTDAEAADKLGNEARAGRLDPEAPAAVLEAAGHSPPRFERPAG
jgi:HD-GYP domain-containing protein (c-di-GMP phosphodiesterase class II)